jgi:hypothetical protein
MKTKGFYNMIYFIIIIFISKVFINKIPHHEAETHPSAGGSLLMKLHSIEKHANRHADPGQVAMDHIRA